MIVYIYITIEISKSATEYCKKVIEGQYKFQKELLRTPVKLEDADLRHSLSLFKNELGELIKTYIEPFLK